MAFRDLKSEIFPRINANPSESGKGLLIIEMEIQNCDGMEYCYRLQQAHMISKTSKREISNTLRGLSTLFSGTQVDHTFPRQPLAWRSFGVRDFDVHMSFGLLWLWLIWPDNTRLFVDMASVQNGPSEPPTTRKPKQKRTTTCTDRSNIV